MKYLILITAVALAGCQQAPPPATGPTALQAEFAPVPMVAPSGSMMQLLNSARAAQGLGPLTEDSTLSRAALAHAMDMQRNDYFSHVGQNGSSFTDRARAAGYSCAAAENIAFGQSSEAEVMAAWMSSSGHRRNILLGDATEFGIGRVGNIWVQMFGRGC